MTISFHPMNAEAVSFPAPKVAVTPVLGALQANSSARTGITSAFDDGDSLFLRSGRAAFALVLRSMGIGKGDCMLMPAYHCGSMIESVMWAEVEPIFFRVDRNLEANLDDIRAALPRKPKALLLAHYFGFPQPLRVALQLCHDNDMILIEDCAHSYFGKSDLDVQIGMGGDFSIASVPKFFPTFEGGLLRINQASTDIAISPLGDLKEQLRAAITPLEIAGQFGHGGLIAKWVARLRSRPATNEYVPVNSEPSAPNNDEHEHEYQWLVPEDVGVRGTYASQFYWRNVDRDAMAAARISNWQTLSAAVGQMPDAEGLFSALPDDVVPYMFPLLLKEDSTGFVELKRRGVPIWRWEDLAISECPVASDYRLRLLQIPCHQSITADEMQWLIQQLSEVLGGATQAGAR